MDLTCLFSVEVEECAGVGERVWFVFLCPALLSVVFRDVQILIPEAEMNPTQPELCTDPATPLLLPISVPRTFMQQIFITAQADNILTRRATSITSNTRQQTYICLHLCYFPVMNEKQRQQSYDIMQG